MLMELRWLSVRERYLMPRRMVSLGYECSLCSQPVSIPFLIQTSIHLKITRSELPGAAFTDL
jgi:hypothetical protein